MRHATTFSGPLSNVQENSFFRNFGFMTSQYGILQVVDFGVGCLQQKMKFQVLKFSSHFFQSINSSFGKNGCCSCSAHTFVLRLIHTMIVITLMNMGSSTN